MRCECTGNRELVTERKAWIRSMRKIVKEHLEKYMSKTQYAVMMDLWNVDELGKVNQWVSDTNINLEVAVNDPTLLQLRVLVDKQSRALLEYRRKVVFQSTRKELL